MNEQNICVGITRKFIRMSKHIKNEKITYKSVFSYKKGIEKCSQKDIERIKKLCIPPNWKNVIISTSELSHLQATGVDDKGRTQYIYHPMWVLLTSSQKYSRMGQFAKKYSLFEQRIKNDIISANDNYVLAIMFRILQKTFIRVGNDCYAKNNGTYGLTSLEKRHLTFDKKIIILTFIGKKSVPQCAKFKDPHCYDFLKSKLGNMKENDMLFNISPSTMSAYLQKYTCGDFTCKDFRTYGSNVLFLKLLCELDIPKTQKELNNNLNLTYDKVAEKLGHTRAISKKSYVMSVITEQYIINPNQFSKKNPNQLFKMLCC